MMGFETNGIRSNDVRLPQAEIVKLHNHWRDFLKQNREKLNYTESRGIVMCAGGVSYVTCAWVNITSLRMLGCTLPIELWYNAGELSSEIIGDFEVMNAKCKSFNDFTDLDTSGYALKPLAIILSSFKEVLFLDADNVCIKEPTYLFENADYLLTGTIFWKDFWITAQNNPIWKIVNTPFVEEREQESGQLLVNKEKMWQELTLTLYFNLHSNFYYKILHGDKDTFRFAWKALRTSNNFVEHNPGVCGFFDEQGTFRGNTMVQFDSAGEMLFFHRNLLKWDVTGDFQKTWKYVKTFNEINTNSVVDFGFSRSMNALYLNISGETSLHKLEERFEEVYLGILYDLRQRKTYQNYLKYCANS